MTADSLFSTIVFILCPSISYIQRENWLKIKAEKREAKPSKEAILEHMHKYDEKRKAHDLQEKEYAQAKKKELHDQAKLQHMKNKSPPRRKKLFDDEKLPPSSPLSLPPQHSDKPSKDSQSSSDKSSKAPLAKHMPPRKIKKKLLRVKKLDFVEEELERKANEEQAKKDRLAKGKMYGKLVPGKHANHHSPARKRLNLIDPIQIPQPQEPAPDGPIALSIIPSPRSPRTPRIKRQVSKHQNDDMDVNEVGDVISTPKQTFTRKKNKSKSIHIHSNDHNSDSLSPVLSIPKNKKRSPIASRHSSLEDSSSVSNLNTPYEGMVGSDWVAHVMEMDAEEATLADVYESGFEMFMIEKGIISDDL
jgi:hypothetical protein